jgi:plasmid stabilization system protein ParE
MGRLRWQPKAAMDFEEITLHWLQTIDRPETVLKNVQRLRADLKKLAETPMLDRSDPELVEGEQRYFWYYAKGTEFRVYYERLGPKTIRILRLWPSKRKPLEPSEILEEVLPIPEP